MKHCNACGTVWGGHCHKGERYRVATPDGERVAEVTVHQPETFFSLSARISFRGVRLMGHVGSKEGPQGERAHYFSPDRFGPNLEKNLPILRAWLDHYPEVCVDCKASRNVLDMHRSSVLYTCAEGGCAQKKAA